MNCVSCGQPLVDGARFCGYCGHAVRTVAEERRVVTILFADLVGFTGLSESLDPESLKNMIDSAFQRLVRDVVAYGGRVDKIVGDAIVALFGAPVAHEDDAERAVRAALAMQNTLATFADEWGESIRMRIGVNTGEVLVGALRAGGDYTAMGDVVNTAARLQTAADPGTVLVGETTHDVTENVIRYESKGSILLRGRAAAVNVFTPLEALVPPGARPWSPRVPLIGRDSEMLLLGGAVSNSIDRDRAQLILLLGDAGVGKSRLATELADRIESSHSARVFSGRCVPYGEANVWWPLGEVLRQGTGIRDGESLEDVTDKLDRAIDRVLDPDRDSLDSEQVVHGLLHVLGYESPLREFDPARARLDAIEALVAFMRASVREGPIVVRLIDLHWADESILALIDEISERLSRLPLIFLGTARRGLIRRWAPRIGRFNALILNLDPLPRDAARDLLDQISLGREIDDQLADRVLDRAGGNPLFLEELLRFLDKDSPGLADAVELPDSLRGLVAARIDALSLDEQDIVEDAAVWGPSGSLQTLRRMSDARGGSMDVAATVQSLADKELLTIDPRRRGNEWSFRSDVLREVAYGRLTKTDRLARHRRIAEYLESTLDEVYVDDLLVDMLARHFGIAAELARDLGDAEIVQTLEDRTVHWLEQVAERAELTALWSNAERAYTRLLELVHLRGDAGESDDADDSEFRYLLGRARMRIQRWDLDGANVDLSTAGRVASAADSLAAAWVKVVRSDMERRRGQYERARRNAESALFVFREADDLAGQAEANKAVAILALFTSDVDAAEEAAVEALRLGREIGNQQVIGWSLQHRAWTSFVRGELAASAAYVQEAVDTFEQSGDRAGMWWSKGLLSWALLLQGERLAAEELVTEILDAVEGGHDPWAQAMMLTVRATGAAWDGRMGAAVEDAATAVESFERLHEPFGLSLASAMLGRALVASGQVDDGLAMISRSMKTSVDGYWAHRAARLVAAGTLGTPMSSRQRRQALSDLRSSSDGAAGEAAIALSILAVQAGRLDDAEAALDRIYPDTVAADPEAVVRVGVWAARALLASVGEEPQSAGPFCDLVLASDRANYHDRALAYLARALVEGRRGHWKQAAEAARDMSAAVATTDDHVAKATAALILAEVAKRAEPDNAEVLVQLAAQRWGDLGVKPRGWTDLIQRVFG